MSNDPGKLIIISGPSGSGKSTIVAKLLETCPLPLVVSVSATTRPPRPGVNFSSAKRFSGEDFGTERSKRPFRLVFLPENG